MFAYRLMRKRCLMGRRDVAGCLPEPLENQRYKLRQNAAPSFENLGA